MQSVLYCLIPKKQRVKLEIRKENTSFMKRKKVLAIALTCLLIGGVGAGSTVAYLTDQTDTIHNEFTVGSIKIETVDNYTPPTDEVVPNQQVSKEVSVENTGKNTAVVYLEVDVPMENCTTVANDGTKGEKKLQDLVYFQQEKDPITMQQNNFSTDWELLDDHVNETTKVHTYIFGLKTVLPEGETATNLFEKYQVRNIVEDEVLGGTVLNIDVKSYAIQADNIVGDDGAIDTTGTMSKAKLIDIYDRLIKQSDATAIPITK